MIQKRATETLTPWPDPPTIPTDVKAANFYHPVKTLHFEGVATALVSGLCVIHEMAATVEVCVQRVQTKAFILAIYKLFSLL